MQSEDSYEIKFKKLLKILVCGNGLRSLLLNEHINAKMLVSKFEYFVSGQGLR